LHEPHKKYEFGSKVTSITLKNNFVDRGYRGVKGVLGTNIITPDKPGKQRTPYQKQKMRKGLSEEPTSVTSIKDSVSRFVNILHEIF
jgi:hypothetical protein